MLPCSRSGPLDVTVPHRGCAQRDPERRGDPREEERFEFLRRFHEPGAEIKRGYEREKVFEKIPAQRAVRADDFSFAGPLPDIVTESLRFR